MKTMIARCIWFGMCLAMGLGSAVWADSWKEKMQSLNRVWSELLPDVVRTEVFLDKKNQSKIEKNLKRLAELASELGKSSVHATAMPDADLSLPMVASLFRDETQRAYQEFKAGRKTYAQSVLRTVPTYCMGCHTRAPGAANQALLLNSAALKSLDPAAKGQFFTAIRQFDSALEAYESVLSDARAAETRWVEWERSARRALVLAVRVKKDPEITLRILNRILETPKAPLSLKQDAEVWKKSAELWKSEAPRQTPSEAGSFAELERLFSEAQKVQKYPADRTAEMLYLRLSASAHVFLNRFPNSRQGAEVMYLLGVSYESLRDLELWSIHELYYEGCIRKQPHSEIAQSCYRRLEQSLIAAYSGSMGTELPSEVRLRLMDLQKQSEALQEKRVN